MGQIYRTHDDATQYRNMGGEAGDRFLDARGNMSQGLGYYQDMIEGNGPSVAEQQMRAGLDQSIAAQTAMAANARGNQAAAMRQAGTAGAAMQMQGNQQAAQLRAQEQQAAMQGYAGLSGQMAGLDLQQQMGLAGLGMQGQLGAMGGMIDYETERRRQAEQEKQNRWDRGWGIFDRTVGMIGGAMGGAMMSDERCKRAVAELSDEELGAMLGMYANATGRPEIAPDPEALALAEAAVSGEYLSRPDTPRGYAGPGEVEARNPVQIAGPAPKRPPPPAPTPAERHVNYAAAGNPARFRNPARYTGRGGWDGPTAEDLAARDASAALASYPTTARPWGSAADSGAGRNYGLSPRERALMDQYAERELTQAAEREARAESAPVVAPPQVTEAQLAATLREREQAAADALGSAGAYTYDYQPGAGPPGRRVGVMAQDMPAGVSVTTPQGLGIDRDQGLGLSLAASADQERRLRALEEALGKNSTQRGAYQAGRGLGMGLAGIGG